MPESLQESESSLFSLLPVRSLRNYAITFYRDFQAAAKRLTEIRRVLGIRPEVLKDVARVPGIFAQAQFNKRRIFGSVRRLIS